MGRNSPPLKPVDQDDADVNDIEDAAEVSGGKEGGTAALRSALEPIAEDDKRIKKIFSTLDVDRRRRVPALDLVLAINSSPPSTPEDPILSEINAQHLIKMFDVDNDGDVCLYEFYRFLGLELDSVESDEEKDEKVEVNEDVEEVANTEDVIEVDVDVEGDGDEEQGVRPPNSPSPTLGERFSEAMRLANETQNTNLAASLALCDLEGDGTVSTDDLRSTLRSYGEFFSQFSSSEIHAIVNMFDANGDGTVALSEWFAAAGQVFDEEKAGIDTIVRLLGQREQDVLDNSVKNFIDSESTSEMTLSVADFETMISALDQRHNVPLKLATKVGGMDMSVAEIFKLLGGEFDVAKLMPEQLSLSVSSADLSSLPPSPSKVRGSPKKGSPKVRHEEALRERTTHFI